MTANVRNPSIGACWARPADFELLRESGFEYAEILAAELDPLGDESATRSLAEASRRAGLPVRAVHGFIPAELPLVGPTVDRERASSYAEQVIRRAASVGVKTVVFGSGDARRVPADFPRDRAVRQLVDFLRLCAGPAGERGLRIAIEHLNRDECNIVNSIAEARRLEAAVESPHVKTLADLYHLRYEDEPLPDDAWRPVHVHVAGPRREPRFDDPATSAFLGWLVERGYDGPISIECEWPAGADVRAAAVEQLRARWREALEPAALSVPGAKREDSR